MGSTHPPSGDHLHLLLRPHQCKLPSLSYSMAPQVSTAVRSTFWPAPLATRSESNSTCASPHSCPTRAPSRRMKTQFLVMRHMSCHMVGWNLLVPSDRLEPASYSSPHHHTHFVLVASSFILERCMHIHSSPGRSHT